MDRLKYEMVDGKLVVEAEGKKNMFHDLTPRQIDDVKMNIDSGWVTTESQLYKLVLSMKLGANEAK